MRGDISLQTKTTTAAKWYRRSLRPVVYLHPKLTALYISARPASKHSSPSQPSSSLFSTLSEAQPAADLQSLTTINNTSLSASACSWQHLKLVWAVGIELLLINSQEQGDGLHHSHWESAAPPPQEQTDGHIYMCSRACMHGYMLMLSPPACLCNNTAVLDQCFTISVPICPWR